MQNIANNDSEYIKLAKHCIGLDRKKPYIRHGRKFYKPYRNYYYCKKGNGYWGAMVLSGYAGCWIENREGYVSYYLTREGLDWLGECLEIHIYDEED